jgi:hypothetical protein
MVLFMQKKGIHTMPPFICDRVLAVPAPIYNATAFSEFYPTTVVEIRPTVDLKCGFGNSKIEIPFLRFSSSIHWTIRIWWCPWGI